MSGLFRRHSNVVCFFCNSRIPAPQDPNNFCCPACHCWNRYDSSGEIMSFEPAMHDESLNRRSFAKRASPSKDRLPTVYGKGPFCRTCQTNQMLLVNLLANYLPPQDSPQYEQRVALLPEYRESLHARYPPVCGECHPSVEDEIRRKDSMARVKALGGWLNESMGKDRQRRGSTSKGRESVATELQLWRIRGCLWASTLVLSVCCNTAAVIGFSLPHPVIVIQPALPAFVFASLFWTAWDPTYASYRRACIQGRDVRLHGKGKYTFLQMTVWLIRLITAGLLSLSWFKPHLDFFHLCDYPGPLSRHMYFTSCLTIELSVAVICAFTLRLQRPPSIRLVDTKSHLRPSASVDSRSRSSTPFPLLGSSGITSGSQPNTIARSTPMPADADLLASLSLSSKPVITPTNPIFGLPSLVSASSAPSQHTTHGANFVHEDVMEIERDEMAMDWTPIQPSRSGSHAISSSCATSHAKKGKQKSVPDDDDGAWLRPQRFFAPEHPTGLEGLFERTTLVDDTDAEPRPRKPPLDGPILRWIYALSVIPMILAFFVWKLWRRTSSGIIEYPLPFPSYSHHNSQSSGLYHEG